MKSLTTFSFQLLKSNHENAEKKGLEIKFVLRLPFPKGFNINGVKMNPHIHNIKDDIRSFVEYDADIILLQEKN